MIEAMHFDGIILMLASIFLAFMGQSRFRWAIRFPLFALAFCDFALAINLLGIYRLAVQPTWIWLRAICDTGTLGAIVLYFSTRYRFQPNSGLDKSVGRIAAVVQEIFCDHHDPGPVRRRAGRRG